MADKLKASTLRFEDPGENDKAFLEALVEFLDSVDGETIKLAGNAANRLGHMLHDYTGSSHGGLRTVGPYLNLSRGVVLPVIQRINAAMHDRDAELARAAMATEDPGLTTLTPPMEQLDQQIASLRTMLINLPPCYRPAVALVNLIKVFVELCQEVSGVGYVVLSETETQVSAQDQSEDGRSAAGQAASEEAGVLQRRPGAVYNETHTGSEPRDGTREGDPIASGVLGEEA